jgi:hypothetical protein
MRDRRDRVPGLRQGPGVRGFSSVVGVSKSSQVAMRRALANGDMSGRMTKESDGWRVCAAMKELVRLEGPDVEEKGCSDCMVVVMIDL